MKNVIFIYNEKTSSGKTFISLNLAEAIAKNNFKVLLFDLSLKPDSIFKKMMAENPKPFIEKSGKITVGILSKKIHIVFLDLLPKSSAGEVLTKFLENNLGFLKEKYDYIIFDSNSIFTSVNETALAFSSNLLLIINAQNFMLEEITKPLNSVRKMQTNNGGVKLDFVILNNFIKDDIKSTSSLLNIMQILSNQVEVITLNYNKTSEFRVINNEPWTELGVQFNEMTKKIINKINLIK